MVWWVSCECNKACLKLHCDIRPILVEQEIVALQERSIKQNDSCNKMIQYEKYNQHLDP